MLPRHHVADLVVEIPAGTRNKYEVDHEVGRLRLDRQLPSSLAYPADYGFFPGTLSGDGDALDGLLLIDEPVVPGCVVQVMPLGVLWVTDEEGQDPKLVTVLPVAAERDGLFDLADLPAGTLDEIEHFFSIYKDLEPDRSVETHGYAGREAALRELAVAKERHLAAHPPSIDRGHLRSVDRPAGWL